MTAQTNLEKLQDLLRQMFQFDCSDLDFGIYRIMNHKRDVIEKFIKVDLVKAVSSELDKGALAAQSDVARELEEVRKKIAADLGEDAIDAQGELAGQFKDTKIGKKYVALRERAAGAQGRQALETLIFNHLFTFFRRYYDDGDFMSRRRYSKKERYAIPYNGEEVHLHWANSDQYYIKTGEYFRDYSFRSHGVTVHFKLKTADVEQDNVKGDKRFFVPVAKKTSFDSKARELVIPFEYRPLTEQEAIKYGKKNQQEAILKEAVDRIPKQLTAKSEAAKAVLAERRKTSEGEPVTFLEHHLRQYTRRNTSDFFIHKDLEGFLKRELDFYLKNEVLNIDELEASGETRAEGWFQVLRTLKSMGHTIITFLAQIENFQKRLFEKKKFVTETQYLVTMGSIPETFYPEIARNEEQWKEWKELFHIDEEKKDLFAPKDKERRRIAFLKRHPTLVLDTRYFDPNLVDQLLAATENLDAVIDGVLIYGDNLQALNLCGRRYHGRVGCVYIDPPFNSPSTEILYKNDYKHSSWLSLLADRIAATASLLKDGVFVVAIDENEQERLGLLLDRTWLKDWKRVCVAIRHNPRGIQGRNFSHCHEYAYFLYPSDDKKYIGERLLECADIRNLRDSGLESDRSDARNCFYPIIVREGKIVDIGEIATNDFHPKGVNERNPDGTISVWPIDTKGEEKKWRYARQSVERILTKLHVRETRGKAEIHFAKDSGTVRTLWTEAEFDASEYGTKLLQDMLGRRDVDFSYPKSLHTLLQTIRIASLKSSEQYILDYFAGSGTTAHATICVNREDGGRRRFIVAEVNDYFDNVMVPRLKKAVFAPEWKDGKPKRPATKEDAERSPRIIKCIRLESYEDALSNISFAGPKGQKILELDDDLLKYMLAWETAGSETLLNVEKLASPFSYKLRLTEEQETREKTVDLPETFNYLLGLHVKTRRVHMDKDRRYLVYRGSVDGRETAVIWRDTKGWGEKDLERDKKFVLGEKLADGADDVFVNGDSFIPKAKALETVFKARMFGGV